MELKGRVSQAQLNIILKEHRLWIRSKKQCGKEADLSSLDISNLRASLESLSCVKFINSVAKNVNFTRSSLREALAENANFTGSNFFSTKLTNGRIINCNLSSTDMRECLADYTDFSGSDLSGARLQNSSFINSNFTNIVANKNTDFRGAILYNVTIDGKTKDSIENLKIGASFIYKSSLKIIRRIEFPLGYQRAGVSLLAYFSGILNEKYSNQDVKVEIEQKGSRVKLVIEAADNEILEKSNILLRKYNKLIRNRLTPAEFYKEEAEDKDLKIACLQNKLDFVRMELNTIKRRFRTNKSEIRLLENLNLISEK